MFFGIERREGSQQSEYFAVNNVYLNGVRIAAVNSECRALFYHTDQVDSVKVVTDDLGLPVTHSEYLPYGELLAQEGNECNREQFNSQAKDKESGLYYFNARHYDAGIARFVTADTVVDGEYSLAGWNRYMYCGGNPVLYKDPSGHSVIGGIIILAVWLIIDDMIDPSGEIADDEANHLERKYQKLNKKDEAKKVKKSLNKNKSTLKYKNARYVDWSINKIQAASIDKHAEQITRPIKQILKKKINKIKNIESKKFHQLNKKLKGSRNRKHIVQSKIKNKIKLDTIKKIRKASPKYKTKIFKARIIGTGIGFIPSFYNAYQRQQEQKRRDKYVSKLRKEINRLEKK